MVCKDCTGPKCPNCEGKKLVNGETCGLCDGRGNIGGHTYCEDRNKDKEPSDCDCQHRKFVADPALLHAG